MEGLRYAQYFSTGGKQWWWGGRAIKISGVCSGIPSCGNEMKEGERKARGGRKAVRYRHDMDCKERVLCGR